jgi:HSF-type DNA-binding
MEHNPTSTSGGLLKEIKEEERVDEDGSEAGGSMDDGSGQHHPIAEFLYQLTKMLTDDNNEIIEWVDGRIKVHYPERLEGEVLHKYFRHSKFASFQRQLNYFGFRKIAGKGKMSPCSYVNEAASSDIRSLLLIKRKTNGSAARKAAIQQQRAAALAANSNGFVLPPGALTGALNFPALNFAPANVDPQALANAMAFLQQNSMAGLMQPAQRNPPAADLQQLNLLNLQHQLFQKQLLNQQAIQMQQNQAAALNSLLAQQSTNNANVKNAMPTSFPTPNLFNPEGITSLPPSNNSASTSSLEQLQAQLKALTQQQQQHQTQPQPPPANNTASSSSQLTAFLSQVAASQVAQGNNNSRATAALNAQQQAMQPATAAMNSSQSTNHHLFDSAMNLKSLLEEHKAQTELQQAALMNRPGGSEGANLNSTMSFGNMLGSSNRLSSLLSLNSFLGSSRETSLADFAAAIPANVREQLTAEAVNAQLSAAAAAAHHDKYRKTSNNSNTGN